MLLADEWSKGHRVTSPSSKQRSTYRLQLPYRYGVPLLIKSAFLHRLLSQSFYVVISWKLMTTTGIPSRRCQELRLLSTGASHSHLRWNRRFGL